MAESGYVIVRQEAGPFVKAYATDRRSFVRWNHGRTPGEARRRCGPAMSRTTVDKLELRLALFGYDGVFYSLTFAPDQTPQSFKETKTRWDSFLKKLKRWRRQLIDEGRIRGSLEFDYVYRIEHLHDHWHLHVFLRDADFPPAVVRWLWDYGEADDEPYTYKRIHAEQGYRCLAQYITKEVPEVGRHAWGCNRGLSAKLPEPKISFSKTGKINLPKEAVLLPVKDPGITEWGVFNFVRWLSS